MMRFSATRADQMELKKGFEVGHNAREVANRSCRISCESSPRRAHNMPLSYSSSMMSF